MSYSTGFGFLIVRLSYKPHPLQITCETNSSLGRTESCWKEDSFTLFTAISQDSTCHLCACGPRVGVHQAMALIGDTMQSTNKRKSGPVETGLTILTATPFVSITMEFLT